MTTTNVTEVAPLALFLGVLLVGALIVPGPAAAQEDDDGELRITLERESEAEARMAEELRALVGTYDLEPWILTRDVRIDERSIPHSHPVLTLHTRHIGSELGLLATFVHEQLHWLEEEPWRSDFRAAMDAYEEIFPEVPTSEEGGARDRQSTYRHLLVCDMEYQALTRLVGEERARKVLASIRHYEWIYDKVLTDPRVREVALRHGFDVSEGVPRG